jgi:hypothetical protein
MRWQFPPDDPARTNSVKELTVQEVHVKSSRSARFESTSRGEAMSKIRILAAVTAATLFLGAAPANAQCDPQPKNVRQQCAKQVGGACLYRREFNGYRWWAQGAAQNQALIDCLRKRGIR